MILIIKNEKDMHTKYLKYEGSPTTVLSCRRDDLFKVHFILNTL